MSNVEYKYKIIRDEPDFKELMFFYKVKNDNPNFKCITVEGNPEEVMEQLDTLLEKMKEYEKEVI